MHIARPSGRAFIKRKNIMKALVLRVWEFINTQITPEPPINSKEEETWLGI